ATTSRISSATRRIVRALLLLIRPDSTSFSSPAIARSTFARARRDSLVIPAASPPDAERLGDRLQPLVLTQLFQWDPESPGRHATSGVDGGRHAAFIGPTAGQGSEARGQVIIGA